MFQIDYCEYNRTNVDYDRIYRPGEAEITFCSS